MRNYLPEIRPDGFTGAIVAIEGIRDAAVLLNAPTGCKFHHGALSDDQFPRVHSMDPSQFSEDFYFGQPRVPATYLDDHDYIFGATAKLEKILPVVAARGHRLIAVVNSPGAALIGDDLERFIQAAGLPIPCVAIESTGFSDRWSDGFQSALLQTLQHIAPPRMPVRKAHVNLLGLSIHHHHWRGNLEELTRLLTACGVRVNAVACAGCSLNALRHIGTAELNVVIHEECADQLAPFLQTHFGQPYLMPEAGAPIGFQATGTWIEAICRQLSVSCEPARRLIRQARQQACESLGRFHSLTGLPKGATFAIHADASVACPLTLWLHTYLGMVPLAVRVPCPHERLAGKLRQFLNDIGCNDAWQAPLTHIQPDVAIGSEAFIARFRIRGVPVTGIDIALPGSARLDVILKSFMGPRGSLWLIEHIINGLYVR